jgi:endonuclease-3 related protein
LSAAPDARHILTAAYDTLLAHYGPQHWWPYHVGGVWEVMIGCVLTQHTQWSNVELSLGNLMAVWGPDALARPELVLDAPIEALAAMLRPTGFYSTKPQRLKDLAAYLHSKGGPEAYRRSTEPTSTLRDELLAIKGVGPETADAILLYGLDRPVYVGDAYSGRLAARWGLIPLGASYHAVRALYMDNLPHDAALFNEFHALVVRHARTICRPRARCEVCPLGSPIPLERNHNPGAWECPRLYTARKESAP